MDEFIQRESIHRYQKLLDRVTDENQRQVLLNLLSEEKNKRPKDHPPTER
jgi:rubrerythrin